jgi:hypothetical protein
VGWICRGGPVPGRPRSLSPALDRAGGGPIPPGYAQPVTGRGVGQSPRACAQPVIGRGVGLAQLTPAASAQPQTGRGVGQLAPGAWACVGRSGWRAHALTGRRESNFFGKRFLLPSGRSAGLAPPPQKASISICSSELVLSLGTLHLLLLLGPLSKFSLNVGALDTAAGSAWSLYV